MSVRDLEIVRSAITGTVPECTAALQLESCSAIEKSRFGRGLLQIPLPVPECTVPLQCKMLTSVQIQSNTCTVPYVIRVHVRSYYMYYGTVPMYASTVLLLVLALPQRGLISAVDLSS